MPIIALAGKEFEVDEDGFIQDPALWTEEVAKGLAATEGIEKLSEYHRKFNVAPPIRMVCKQTGFQLKHIYQLFPGDPTKGACRLAGLPKPTGCI
jgi:tRNA 2-thiouridine synthesizing protein E